MGKGERLWLAALGTWWKKEVHRRRGPVHGKLNAGRVVWCGGTECECGSGWSLPSKAAGYGLGWLMSYRLAAAAALLAIDIGGERSCATDVDQR